MAKAAVAGGVLHWRKKWSITGMFLFPFVSVNGNSIVSSKPEDVGRQMKGVHPPLACPSQLAARCSGSFMDTPALSTEILKTVASEQTVTF